MMKFHWTVTIISSLMLASATKGSDGIVIFALMLIISDAIIVISEANRRMKR